MPASDSPTEWYTFNLPDEFDSMANPALDITDSFEKIKTASLCPVIAGPGPLPQTVGVYEAGDKVFVEGGVYEGVYVCIASDAFWGPWWKPVQAAITPWQVVPATAVTNASYQQHPTIPFSIAIDNKGRLYCRGALQIKPAFSFVNATSLSILRSWPVGMRPPTDGQYPCVIDPVDMANPAGVAALKSGRIYISATGANTHRFYGSTVTLPKTTDIWMSEVRFIPGRNDFSTA